VRVEPFGLGERGDLLRRLIQFLARVADGARASEEVVDAEGGGEARRAARGEHVVRPGEVVADGFGRVRAEEDRAGVSDERGCALLVARDDLKMFGREFVDDIAGLFERGDDEGRAEVCERACDD